MDRADMIMCICGIVLIITTVYLYPRLYGIEKIAWGLWGIAILEGTIASNRKEEKEE